MNDKNKNIFYRVIVTWLLWMFTVASAASEVIEHRVWDKEPIAVVLPLGKERRIDFPEGITVQAPQSVLYPVSSIQVTGDGSGSLYWLAHQAFPETKVIVHSASGYVWLLRLQAVQKDAPTHPIAIVDHRVQLPQTETMASTVATNPQYSIIDLTRYAAQQLFAPQRLITPLPGVQRMPVSTEKVFLYQKTAVTLTPIAQWRAMSNPVLYVTALKVTNASDQQVMLDPRQLHGAFLSASFQHGVLHPAGQDGDETALYLVSSRAFQEAIP